MKPWIAAAALAAVACAGPVETEASAGTGTVDLPAYRHSYLMSRNATGEVIARLDRHADDPDVWPDSAPDSWSYVTNRQMAAMEIFDVVAPACRTVWNVGDEGG